MTGRKPTVVCGHRFCANNPHREAHNGADDWTCFTCEAGRKASGKHSFYWRTEPGRNSGGMRVVSACCPCGWTHMTAYPLLRKSSRVRYLRHRWMNHV